MAVATLLPCPELCYSLSTLQTPTGNWSAWFAHRPASNRTVHWISWWPCWDE